MNIYKKAYKVGNSKGVVLPKKILDMWDTNEFMLDYDEENDMITIKPRKRFPNRVKNKKK